ncbi:MAG: hypothetical protein C4B59_11850 [Candidatus Methanogaster sp.]|uniref:Uncharacterized protein n=1 Tax=Candidatus Methanogaster sp. TaxID=3386292 RepID=A0AC61L0Z8_9EURY|nr:MAG: hypothetical protein C4B59_11850 [ANME-2 cluster archaeon]
MKNKTRLTILKVSCIYGGVFSMVLAGLYVFVVAAFMGTMRYTSIQIILLLTGIVSVTVFSYMHLNYAGKKPEEFACPLLPGILITVICLILGLIFIPALVLLLCLSYVDISSAIIGFMYFAPYHISLILGILSAYAVLSGSRRSPEGLMQWKIRGLQLGTVILAAGVVVSGISLSIGALGRPGMTYTITLDASRIDTAEETTFLVPLPVDTSSGVAADVVDELTVTKGDAVWSIVDTEHGKALEVRTSTKCVLYAEKKCGYMETREREEWLRRHDVSMIHEMDGGTYDVWVYASNADATMYLKLWKATGLRGNIHCLDNDHTSLDEGWQTVELSWSRVLCD